MVERKQYYNIKSSTNPGVHMKRLTYMLFHGVISRINCDDFLIFRGKVKRNF